MKVLVERFDKGSDDTLGRLYIDDKLICFTIEDEMRAVKVKGNTAIPFGTYKIGTRHSPKFSPKFGHDMLWIKEVPGFEYILIHTGNTEADTEGCLIVVSKLGVLNGKRAVLESKKAYDIVYKAIKGALDKGIEVTITYK